MVAGTVCSRDIVIVDKKYLSSSMQREKDERIVGLVYLSRLALNLLVGVMVAYWRGFQEIKVRFLCGQSPEITKSFAGNLHEIAKCWR